MHIGIHAYGRKPIREAARHKLGNFIWIPKWGYPLGSPVGHAFPEGGWPEGTTNGYVPDAGKNPAMRLSLLDSVRTAVDLGLAFMISGRRGLGDHLRHGGFGYGGDCSGDFIPPDLLAEISGMAGPLFLGVHLEELDCDYLQNSLAPAYVARCPWLYDYSTREEGRLHLEYHFRDLVTRYRSFGTEALLNISITFHHYAFRAGAAFVIAEVMEHTTSTPLQYAYLRGAAVQYQKPWGIWVSPWFWGKVPNPDTTLWPINLAAPYGGHSAFSFECCLYAAFYSGASLMTQQETEPIFTRSIEADHWNLGPWGEVIRDYACFADTEGEAGTPCVDTAMLLDLDNGWAPAGLWQSWDRREQGRSKDTVWAKWPLEGMDEAIPAVVNYFYPEFHKSGSDQIRYQADEYPGYLNATPHGPMDVLLSDCTLEALIRYRAVVVPGNLTVTPSLGISLRAYVHQGGVLMMNASQVHENGGTLHDLFGISDAFGPSREEHTIRACDQHVLRLHGRNVYDRQDYVENTFIMQPVELEGATVLAQCHNGLPAATGYRYGKGLAVLSAVTELKEGRNSHHLLRLERKLLTQMMRSVRRVALFPNRDVEWILTRRTDNSYRLLLINHGDHAWEGGVILSGLDVDTGWRILGEEMGSTTSHRTHGGSFHLHCSLRPASVSVFGFK